MTPAPSSREPGGTYDELEQRSLRTMAALETLSSDPIPPSLLLERVQEADRLAGEIGGLLRALRLHSVHSGDFRSVSLLAGRLPMQLLREHTGAIEQCMKQVSERGSPSPSLVRPPLVAFRAKAQRLERRHNLISPPTVDDLKKAVRWAAAKGGREEAMLLRRIANTIEPRDGEALNLLRVARADIDVRLKEQVGRLAAIRCHRTAPDQALRAIGEIGSRSSDSDVSRRAPRDMLPEPSPVPALYDVLTSSDDPVLRAEAAWALGHVGGAQAARRLMQHLLDTWSEPSQPTELRPALVAGLGRALDPYSLYRVAKGRPELLRRCYGLLQKEAERPDLPEDGLLMDLVGTLVAIELRAEQVGVDLKAGSSLALLLGAEARPSARTIAAVSALLELTTEADRRTLWRWARGKGDPAGYPRTWPDRLTRAARRPFSAQDLREFLLAAARFSAIREDVEASYGAYRAMPGQERPSASPTQTGQRG